MPKKTQSKSSAPKARAPQPAGTRKQPAVKPPAAPAVSPPARPKAPAAPATSKYDQPGAPWWKKFRRSDVGAIESKR